MSTKTNLSPDELKFSNPFQVFLKFFKPGRIEENVTSVVYMILRNVGIRVTFSTVIEYLKSHPNYPSLKSICDLFDELNITNYPLKFDEIDLYKLTDPFIAHTKDSGGKVILVYTINKERVVYADTLNGQKIIKTSQFLEKWDGVIIAIEPTERSGEVNYTEKRNNEIVNRSLLPSVILTFLIATVFGIISNKSHFIEIPILSIIIFVFIHLFGLTFSILLFRHELNLKTKITDKLCHITSKVDCDAVTHSSASKIFGGVTWADTGVAYFTGGLLTFFILPGTNSLNILCLFSISALPYPIFSILYQWLKIKKWCPLCLSVQAVLIVESLFAFNILKISELAIHALIPVLLIFSSVVLIILLLKIHFISQREKEYLKLESIKFKRDLGIFLYKISKEEKIDLPNDRFALICGDLQSEVVLSIFLSFNCGACAKMFNEIKKLLDINIKIKVQIFFSISKDKLSAVLFKTILELLRSGKNNKVFELLTAWYNMDLKVRSNLLKNVDLNDADDQFRNIINENNLLFRQSKVKRVPAIYVNGFHLPDIYSLEDIRYHIPELEKRKNKLTEIKV